MPEVGDLIPKITLTKLPRMVRAVWPAFAWPLPVGRVRCGAVGACLRARAAAVCAAVLHIAELLAGWGLLRRRGGPVGATQR